MIWDCKHTVFQPYVRGREGEKSGPEGHPDANVFETTSILFPTQIKNKPPLPCANISRVCQYQGICFRVPGYQTWLFWSHEYTPYYPYPCHMHTRNVTKRRRTLCSNVQYVTGRGREKVRNGHPDAELKGSKSNWIYPGI